MKKRVIMIFIMSLVLQSTISGCGQNEAAPANTEEVKGNEAGNSKSDSGQTSDQTSDQISGEISNINKISPDTSITKLEEDLSAVRYDGDYGFDSFLEQGGASSDEEVVEYVSSRLASNLPELLFGGNPFGCSTLSVKSTGDGYLFGRNFDWNACNALIISSTPDEGYASVSTVNMDFIQAGGLNTSILPDEVQAIIGLYAPLDGMNEEGLAVSVNMIEDTDTIEQNTDKPDLTTTTAIRLLLDQAANVEEALDLLSRYDLHASMDMMIHLAIADAEGNSVAVEYVNNEMVVTDTPVVTNFYLAEGEKYGIGTAQSHTRYDLLQQALTNKQIMTEAEVRDALDSVSKDNFGEFESTEWSIVMNQNAKEMTYYHREKYDHGYSITVE